MSRNGTRYSDAERDQLRALWAKGSPKPEELRRSAEEMGRSTGSLRNMAHFLGISADGRKRREQRAKIIKARTPLECLRCGETFLSENVKNNRVCDHCKSSTDWRDGPDHVLGVRV